MVFLILLLIFLPFFSANAYLDPGAGSMLVQVVAVGVAGVLAILKLYWKKLIAYFKRGKINDKK